MREMSLSFFGPPISADPARSVAKLGWIVRLRWIAVAAQLLSILPALEFGLLERRLLPIYLGVIASLALLNLATWIALRRDSMGDSAYSALFQLGADVTTGCLFSTPVSEH